MRHMQQAASSAADTAYPASSSGEEDEGKESEEGDSHYNMGKESETQDAPATGQEEVPECEGLASSDSRHVVVKRKKKKDVLTLFRGVNKVVADRKRLRLDYYCVPAYMKPWEEGLVANCAPGSASEKMLEAVFKWDEEDEALDVSEARALAQTQDMFSAQDDELDSGLLDLVLQPLKDMAHGLLQVQVGPMEVYNQLMRSLTHVEKELRRYMFQRRSLSLFRVANLDLVRESMGRKRKQVAMGVRELAVEEFLQRMKLTDPQECKEWSEWVQGNDQMASEESEALRLSCACPE